MEIISNSYLSLSLILQTLQQLRDVYGDSVDRIVQGNTSNIIFLKSTDDDMLKTLETMSGVTHVTRTDSKTITENMGNITDINRSEDKLSRNYAVKEEPVISFNDMAFIPDRNSMVFRAGDSPIWNRQEMILPMSWRLFQNTIVHPGHDYTLQTVPTLSTAMDFDVRKNQPDFMKWFDKRLLQMTYVDEAIEKYKELHGYSDRDVELLDPDIYADDIMRIINGLMNPDLLVNTGDDDYDENAILEEMARRNQLEMSQHAEDNDEYLDKVTESAARQKHYTDKIYARGKACRADFVNISGHINHGFDKVLVDLFREEWQKFADDEEHFSIRGDRSAGFAGRGDLMSADGSKVYFRFNKQTARLDADDIELLSAQSESAGDRVYAEDKDDIKAVYDAIATVEITNDFYRFLITLDSAEFNKLAGGVVNERLYQEIVNGTFVDERG